MASEHRLAHTGWRLRGAAGAAMIAVAACGPSSAPSTTSPVADGWHEFQGSWSATGNRHTIPLGGDRRASIVDLQGSMVLAGPARPGVGFRAEAIALGDTATGMVGRAVWTDENGDRVFSELRGTGTATGAKVSGTFVGGTGRYAGAGGSYEFTWQYVLEGEDGMVQGRTVGLAGRVRVGQPEQAAVKP